MYSSILGFIYGNNINQDFIGIPIIPSNITATYNVTTVSNSSQTGEVNLSVTLSANNATPQTSKFILVSGFETTQDAIKSYINNFESNKTISGINTILPSSIDPTSNISMNNIINYFNDISSLPTLPNGVVATFNVSNISDVNGTLDLSVTLTFNSKSTISSFILIKSFLTTNQQSINIYINSFNISTITSKGNISYLSIIGSITSDNINKYFNGIPAIPTNIKAKFNVSTTSNSSQTGEINLSVTLNANNAITQTSTTILVSGFLISTENAMKNYINKFEESSTIIKGINTILPSDINPTSNITFNDIHNYFSGIFVPQVGIIATFNIDTTTNSDINGTVNLIVKLSANNNTSLTSTPITIIGFLTTNQAIINSYISKFEKSNITWVNNSTIPSNIFPNSNINITTMQNYFNGISNLPNAITTANFSISTTSTSDTTGIVNLSVTLNAPYAVATVSTSIATSGWKNEIDNYIDLFQKDKTNITGLNTILPSNIPETISSSNMSNYFTNIPSIPMGFSAIFNVTTSQNSNTEGFVNLSVTLSTQQGGISITSQPFKVSGFQNTLLNYINALQNDNSIKAINNTTTPSSIPMILNSNNVDKYFSGIPTIPTGVAVTFTVTNPSNLNGTVTLVVKLDFNKIFSLSSSQITVNGFSSEIQNYVNNFNWEQDNITGVNSILPSNMPLSTPLSYDNISNYFNNIPLIPAGSSPTFTITTTASSDTNGTVNLLVTFSSYPGTLSSTAILISGCLTTNQNLINNYISKFESPNQISLATAAQMPYYSGDNSFENTLPSNIIASINPLDNINYNNINTYFDGVLSIPSEINAVFQIDVNTNSDETGIIGLSVTLNGSNATATTSNQVQISGCLTTNQNWINVLNPNPNASQIVGGQYVQAIVPISSIPATISSTNIDNYFHNIPPIPAGSIITFTTSVASLTNGLIDLTITTSYKNGSLLGLKPYTFTIYSVKYNSYYNS